MVVTSIGAERRREDFFGIPWHSNVKGVEACNQPKESSRLSKEGGRMTTHVDGFAVSLLTNAEKRYYEAPSFLTATISKGQRGG